MQIAGGIQVEFPPSALDMEAGFLDSTVQRFNFPTIDPKIAGAALRPLVAPPTTLSACAYVESCPPRSTDIAGRRPVWLAGTNAIRMRTDLATMPGRAHRVRGDEELHRYGSVADERCG